MKNRKQMDDRKSNLCLTRENRYDKGEKIFKNPDPQEATEN
jgi:hypothetical protein